jgi:hypothetical protein
VTVDPRCLIATDLGILLDGSGLSEDHAQETGLVTYRGTFTFDGLHTPARGRVIQLAYARPQYGTSGTLSRFYPRLHCISSSADPFANGGNGITTVEVGCALTLKADKRDAITYRAIDHPPAWWTALSSDRKAVVPPTISAQGVIEFCLDQLGINLAASSATSPDVFLRDELDLSGGYVEVLSDLLKDALLVGHMTPAGELFVQPLQLKAGNGPVLTRNNLLAIQPINDRGGAEQVTVDYDAVEIPGADTAESIDINSDEQKLRDWEFEQTIGPPTVYEIIVYGRIFRIGVTTDDPLPEPSQWKVPVEVIQVSQNRTKYKTFDYTDSEGKQKSQDLAIQRTSTTRASNGGRLYFWIPVSSERFYVPPSGAIPYDTDAVTDYTYEITTEGPRLKTELTKTFNSPPKFVTALPVDSFVIDGDVVTLPTDAFEVSRVLVENEVDEVSGLTKRKTTRWAASGKTQAGSQASRFAFEGVATVEEFNDAVDAASPLVMEGTEVSISLGRQSGIQSRPSAQSRQRDALTGAFLDDNSLISSGTVSSSKGQREPQTVTASYSFGGAGSELLNTATYRLTYAPDDFVTAVNGISTGIVDLTLVRGNARGRALEYGRVQNAIAFGHANGVEVTTAPWELPSPPFAPVYVDVSGLSTAFRVHGRNWEISNGCMIVTADLCLVGTAGRLTGGTPVPWMPLTSAAGDLNALGAPTGSGELLPANTITLPGGFNPAAPGAVWSSLPANGSDTYGPNRTPAAIAPPYVQTVEILAVSRSAVVVTELLYSTSPITESILAVSRSMAEVREVAVVNAPLTTLTLTPLAPAVYAPVVVRAPLTTLTLTPLAPNVAAAAAVNAPLTTLALTPLAPTVTGSAVVYPPLVTMTLTALAPTLTPNNSDPDFASVSFLLPLNGTNGSTTFTDASSNSFTVTGSGNAQISTAQSKWGGSSLLLDGTGDYLFSATSLAFTITGDFTVEFWCNLITLSGVRTLLHVCSSSDNNGLHIYTNGDALCVDNGLTADYVSGSVMATGTWTFIRVSKSGSTLYIAKDNTVLNSRTAQSYGTPVKCVVGHFTGIGGETGDANGYFQDVRITKGIARSTTTLGAPTVRFPTSGPTATDPDFSSVALLLPMNGANGSTTFTDLSSSGRAVTVNGNAQISTTRSKWGGSSGYFDGTGDYLDVTVSGGFGTGAFCVEMWIYPETSNRTLFNSRANGTSGDGFDVISGARMSTNGAVIIPSDSLIVENAWNHVAFFRTAAGDCYRAVGGILTGPFSFGADWTGGAFNLLGNPHAGGNAGYFNGYVNDLRITVGVARYTADFTPPTGPFPTG